MGRGLPVCALTRLLHKMLPRSLRAQMMLLTLGVVLLVQAATFATVTWSWRKFTEHVAVDLTVTTLHTLRSALAEVPADERAEFVRRASSGQWRLWSRSLPSHTRLEHRRQRRDDHAGQRPDAPPRNDVRRVLRSFVDALNERLGDNTRVALSRGPDPKLFISLLGDPDSGDDPYSRDWLVIPLDRIAPPIGTPIILLWLGGMGIFLLLAAAFSWHITRPLTRLAKAADQLAAGQPQRVIPSGPSETRALGHRFNAMLDTLAESSAVQRTLLAGLPHDLKGPLSRMWLRVEMLDDAAFQEGMRKDVQDMQRMIDQFIGFVRGSDPGSYQFASMDLDPWLDEKVEAWQSAGSDVSRDGPAQTSTIVMADRMALDRLADNLITNALHHGKEPIVVSLTRHDGNAVLAIVDHGPGITAERRAEALRPFSRLDDARTRTGSVGLGLALAETIAKAHKGSLQLDNGEQPGTGLRVSVTLPLAGSSEA